MLNIIEVWWMQNWWNKKSLQGEIFEVLILSLDNWT